MRVRMFLNENGYIQFLGNDFDDQTSFKMMCSFSFRFFVILIMICRQNIFHDQFHIVMRAEITSIWLYHKSLNSKNCRTTNQLPPLPFAAITLVLFGRLFFVFPLLDTIVLHWVSVTVFFPAEQFSQVEKFACVMSRN